MTAQEIIFDTRPQRAWRWSIAAALVIAAHIAGAAVAMREPHDQIDDAGAGAMLVELAPIAIATPRDIPDVAHGVLAADSQPSLPTVREATKEVREEAPPAERAPLAPEPEVALPTPSPAPDKKAAEDHPVQDERRDAADRPAEASIAAAPPRVEAPKEAVAEPSVGATAAAAARVRATWERALVGHLGRHKRYPTSARTLKQQGTVNVAFTIDREGRVISARVLRSSGSSSLDEEATAVLRRASPLPAPPDAVPGATFDLTLPIQFRIR